MWRGWLSGVAIAVDVLILVFMVIGALVQGGEAPHPAHAAATSAHVTRPAEMAIVLGVFIGMVGINILAILFGARPFPPRKPPSDLVSTFD